MKYYFPFLSIFLLSAAILRGQHYTALQGSSYAGALNVNNNPASLVNTPYKWDFTLFGSQLSSSTNAFTIYNYSYLSNPANSLYYLNAGNYARKFNPDANLNLLNARIALNRKSSIAFGLNVKSYTNLKTSPYNFIDTLENPSEFLDINPGLQNLNAHMVSSSWVEGYIGYARTISENSFGRLSAGAVIRISRGISGAVANINNIGFSTDALNNPVVSSADLTYGYSSNFDQIKSTNSGSQNFNNLFAYSESGASVDGGIEYIIKPQGTTSFGDDDDYYDYDWKFGLSLMDLGGNRFKYGLESRTVTNIKSAIPGSTLDAKFDSTISSLAQFNDSLATLASSNYPGGRFTILNPTRLVINVDRYITGNFYINGQLSLNLPMTSLFKGYLQVKDIHLLTVTPRWETSKFGVYLPIQFNTQNQFWVGAAFKAGPLIFGFHNWANLFSKTSVQNGGGYIALIFHAGKDPEGKTDKRLNCPKPVW